MNIRTMDPMIQQQIDNAKEQFYAQHTKARIFKNNQKLECAKAVSEQVDVMKLIQMTAVIIPNTNKIYINYPLFKTYGHHSISPLFYEHFLVLVQTLVNQYGCFEIHVNLNSFTVSACARYNDMICTTCDQNEDIMRTLTDLHVYHTPNVIQQITQMLYHSVKTFIPLVHYHNKNESDALVQQLFEHV